MTPPMVFANASMMTKTSDEIQVQNNMKPIEEQFVIDDSIAVKLLENPCVNMPLLYSDRENVFSDPLTKQSGFTSDTIVKPPLPPEPPDMSFHLVFSVLYLTDHNPMCGHRSKSHFWGFTIHGSIQHYFTWAWLHQIILVSVFERNTILLVIAKVQKFDAYVFIAIPPKPPDQMVIQTLSMLLSCFSIQFIQHCSKKEECYIVYLGLHCHGPTPSFADLEIAISYHYDLLAINYSYNKQINGFTTMLEEEEEAAQITINGNVASVF
ncbi:uncharacterized protein LOC131631635 [Vicia villosa]|uniref:uncharacterized protein LOC131631635 n=1 Tax=Vicia villosa TaxID=3911 RepID=UPI00273B6EC3|nr:uncharacterized protein LOC131631635 [Vicia villosa]